MSAVQEAILVHSKRLPEGTVLAPKSLLHLGSRAAVDQALSRMARRGELLRVSRGRYVRPRQTRFGPRAPSVHEVAARFSRTTGETIVPSGAQEAHSLGLTSQVPIRTVYLTSGPNRRLELGKQDLEFRKAPSWKLSGPGTKEGAVMRAVEWMGREVPQEAVERAVSSLQPEERQRLLQACAAAPTWLARRLTRAVFPEPPGDERVDRG
ncbi:MAG: DUF6088 family protein [Gemmatimonadota bacterium]